jgi:hypothetical protein
MKGSSTMSNNKHSIAFMNKPEPPAHQVEETLDWLVSMDLGIFADHLETARRMWRRFPELVLAPDFPEQLRKVFVKEVGYKPSDDSPLTGEEALDPSYRESKRPEAVELARRLMDGEHEEHVPAPMKETARPEPQPMSDGDALVRFEAAVIAARNYCDDRALQALTITLSAYADVERASHGLVQHRSSPRFSMLFFLPAALSAGAARVQSIRRRFLSAFTGFWS